MPFSERELWEFNEKLRCAPTPRVMALRERVLHATPSISSERARLVTHSYMETEGQPILLRRAHALNKILREMTIYIAEGELIIGNMAPKPRAAPIFPEMGTEKLEESLEELSQRPQDRMDLTENVKTELRATFPYWKGKTVREKVFAALPDDVIRARRANMFTLDNHEDGGLGHVLPDFPSVLQNGFRSLIDSVQSKMDMLDLAQPESYKKWVFWRSAVVVMEAAIAFAERFAAEAERLAVAATSDTARAELLHAAEICRRVPALPARTLQEAIQSCYLVDIIIQIETNGTAISPGRLDQILYPYYLKDRDAGSLSFEQAQELIDCLWVKLNELIKLRSNFASRVHAGFPMNENVCIGGQDEHGQDATNELSFMFLNSCERVRLSHPQFSMRVHKKTPDALLMRAIECIKIGSGRPQLVSDEVIVPALCTRGVPLTVARTWAPIGCVEAGVHGLWGRGNGGYFNTTKVLELTLGNGIDQLTGQRLGPATGDATLFTSFDQVREAFDRQMANAVYLLAIENNVIDLIHAENVPHVFMSCVITGALESGKDVTEGGALYNWTGPLGVGLANTANSLAALKRVVFDDKKATMAEVIQALAANFEGHEPLRQKLLHAPKYGNDDDAADLMAHFVVEEFVNHAKQQPTPRGGNQGPCCMFSLSSNLPLGWSTAATPDGRKSMEPLADGISATHGTDLKGPSAMLKSASKIDHQNTAGSILNLKFHPMVLKTRTDSAKLGDLFRTYLVDLGGAQVQANIVSADLLRDAQKNPERHRDLIVRVTGYSAYFTELSKELQDDIIGRTEHLELG